MKRRLLNWSAAASLALAIAATILAGRSAWVSDTLQHYQSRAQPDGSSWSSDKALMSTRGQLIWKHEFRSATAADNRLMLSSPMARLAPPVGPEPPQDRWEHESSPAQWNNPDPTLANRLGFGAGRVVNPSTGNPPAFAITIAYAWVPWWLVIALCLFLPLLAFRRYRRHPDGHCAMCGYDLRATPDRCPECGKVSQVSQESD